jgi:hypothetical protein
MPMKMTRDEYLKEVYAGHKATEASRDGSPAAFDPQELLTAQEYMLMRQQEIVAAAIRDNNRHVRLLNELTIENEKLRRELEGHRRSKLWTMIVAMLPTQEMLRR